MPVTINCTKYPKHNLTTALASVLPFSHENTVLMTFFLSWMTNEWVFQQKDLQRTGILFSLPSCAIKILTYVAPKSMTFQTVVSFTFLSTSNGISLSLRVAEPPICSCPCAATQLPLTSPHHPISPSPPKPSRTQPAATELIGGSDNAGVN